MEVLDKWLTRSYSSYGMIAFVGSLTLLMAIIIPWSIPAKELSGALQSLATLNITVAIGMGTIAITLKEKDSTTTILIKDIIVLLLLSVLSFFISYWDVMLVKRIYMLLSGILLVSIIVSITRFFKEHIDVSSNRKDKKSNGKNKNKKKSKS